MPQMYTRLIFRKKHSLLASFKTGEIIFWGDLNCVLNQDLDRPYINSSPAPRKSVLKESTKLNLLLTPLDLNIWRTQHPQEKDYTYFFWQTSDQLAD